jgi:5-methylcytosine-specific restriction endonuclease McrA
MNDTNLVKARESSRNLSTLLHHEQGAMADFLVALADFDRRVLWRALGHSCLFYYLQRELRLSDGAAHFRKVAARLIQRFPEVVEPLREGKLCLTSIVELARVMTPENRAETLPQFFHVSKRQAKAVAAAILPAAVIPRREVVTRVATVVRPEILRAELRPDETPLTSPEPEVRPVPPMRVEPLTANESRIHLTVSNQFLKKLEAARRGQGHVQPGASKEQVIEAALDLLLEKQASRRAEAKRPQKKPRPAKPDRVTAALKRAVWARDGGKCQWPLDGGGVCGSTTRLEIDHVVPRGTGGPSTVENCRLVCRVHNQYSARQVYGDEVMDLFTRNPVAREPCACYFVDGAVSPSSHSRLPAGPAMGDSACPSTAKPSSRAAASTPSSAAMRFASSRTTPPFPTSPFPTSNCGFTSSTAAPPGLSSAFTAGSTSRSEMNDRSPTTRSTSSPSAPDSRNRAFTRSCTTTRGSPRNLGWSCP